jgi:hypothetical protein
VQRAGERGTAGAAWSGASAASAAPEGPTSSLRRGSPPWRATERSTSWHTTAHGIALSNSVADRPHAPEAAQLHQRLGVGDQARLADADNDRSAAPVAAASSATAMQSSSVSRSSVGTRVSKRAAADRRRADAGPA